MITVVEARKVPSPTTPHGTAPGSVTAHPRTWHTWSSWPGAPHATQSKQGTPLLPRRQGFNQASWSTGTILSQSLYLSLSISLYLYLSLSISLYLYLSLYLSLSLSLSLSLFLSLSFSLCVSIYLYLTHTHTTFIHTAVFRPCWRPVVKAVVVLWLKFETPALPMMVRIGCLTVGPNGYLEVLS